MTSEKAEVAQNRKKNRKSGYTQPVLYCLKIGFYAGLIWGLIRWLLTGLNFTYVTQAFLLDPFVARKHLGGFYWQAAGLGMFIIMSIIAALLYIVLLKSLKGPWPGLWFGALWWAIVYAWVGPMIGAVPPLNQIGWSSIVTDFCLFVIWGLFIGFSISFEFHNEAESEPSDKAADMSAQPSS